MGRSMEKGIKYPLTNTGDYTYSFMCKCKAELYVEISKEIDFDPKCLSCHSSQLQLRYSIIHGTLWMNDDILHE